MDKLGRNYKLEVEANSGGFVEIELPFSMEFDITRNYLSSANTFSISIYNLGKETRRKIEKDPNDITSIRTIILKAGYGENLSLIARGYVSKAFSHRGGVDYITQIDSYDWWSDASKDATSLIVNRGTPYKNVIGTVVDGLKPAGVERGKIGDFSGTTSRATSFSGSTTDIIRDMSGGNFFIDNGKANVLKDDEFFEGEISEINADTGLLGTPQRYETFIEFDMIFEPRIQIGQKLKLESRTFDNYNGIYKVASIHHKGLISPTICGSAVTTIGLLYGKTFNEVF